MPRQLLTAFLLLITFIGVRAHTDADGYEAFTHLGKHTVLNAYKLHTSRATWDNANAACIREGAHLLIIDSIDEVRLSRTLWTRVPPAGTNLDQLHVGITDAAQEGVWKTVLGAPVGHHVGWAAGQPDNAGTTEHCGAITRDVLYNDLPCNKLYPCPFICEKEIERMDAFNGGSTLEEVVSSLNTNQDVVDNGTRNHKYQSRFLAILLRL